MQGRQIIGHSVRGRELVAHVLGDGGDTTIVFGGFHGDEPSSVHVAQALLAHLVEHPPASRVIIVPNANPDGAAAGTRGNAHGVDLNRNLPNADWSPIAAKLRYAPGPRPASEPEIQAIIALLERYPPDKVISLHAPLTVLNWTGPGEELAAEMSRHSGLPTVGDIGYPTPGSFGTYCGVELGVAMVTYELDNAPGPAAWRQSREALLAGIRFRTSG